MYLGLNVHSIWKPSHIALFVLAIIQGETGTLVEFGLKRVGVAHDVTVNVSTCSQRVHAHFCYGLNERLNRQNHKRCLSYLQAPLKYAMELYSLSSRNLDSRVGEFVRNIVKLEPLSCGADTTRAPNTDHEGKRLL